MDNKINELCKTAKCNKWIAWGVAIVVIVVALILSFVTIKNGLDNSSKSCNLHILVVSDSLSNVKHLLSDACKMSPANQKKDTSSVSDTTNSKSPAKASMTQNNISGKIYVTDTSVILLYCCILVFIAFSLGGAFTMLFKVMKFENDMRAKILDVQKEIYKEKQMWELATEKKLQEFKDKEQELSLNKRAWDELEKERTNLKYEQERNLESIRGGTKRIRE